LTDLGDIGNSSSTVDCHIIDDSVTKGFGSGKLTVMTRVVMIVKDGGERWTCVAWRKLRREFKLPKAR
jgi:hypothetical protein